MRERFNQNIKEINELHKKLHYLKETKEILDQNLKQEVLAKTIEAFKNYSVPEVSFSDKEKEEILEEVFKDIPKAYDQNLEDYILFTENKLNEIKEKVLGEDAEKNLYLLKEEVALSGERHSPYIKGAESLLSFLEADKVSITAFGETEEELTKDRLEMLKLTIQATENLEQLGVLVDSEKANERVADLLADINSPEAANEILENTKFNHFTIEDLEL